jgi:hypothetical protein
MIDCWSETFIGCNGARFPYFERDSIDFASFNKLHNILYSILWDFDELGLIEVDIIDGTISQYFSCVDFPFVDESILKKDKALQIQRSWFEIANIELIMWKDNT